LRRPWVLTLLVPAAAYAYFGTEVNQAAAVSGPSGDYVCVTPSTGVTVCFRPLGDDFFVKDTKADGYSAVAAWQMNGWEPRTGSCVNSLGAGKWGWCNKDLTEGRQLWITEDRYDAGKFVDRGYDLLTTTT